MVTRKLLYSKLWKIVTLYWLKSGKCYTNYRKKGKGGVCPVEALAFDDDGKMECDKDTCIGCQACVGTCPVEAISPAE